MAGAMQAETKSVGALRHRADAVSGTAFLVAVVLLLGEELLGVKWPRWTVWLFLAAGLVFLIVRIGCMIADDVAGARSGGRFRLKTGCLLTCAALSGVAALLHLAFREHDRWVYVGFWVGLAAAILLRLLARHLLRLRFAGRVQGVDHGDPT
ncbi:MAG: hypothetical protein ACYTAF_16510 [Planctomycetota bacterium]|jgi:hypothetical protein